MKVTLFPIDPEMELNKIWVAAKTCYSEKTPQELYEEAKLLDAKTKSDFIEDKIKVGHLSVVEHVHLTFMVSGVSRALTHQFVRHRLCNYSQQSQRYVNLEKLDKGNSEYFVIPPSVESDEKAKEIYVCAMKELANIYRQLNKKGIKAEDARFVLGNGCKTNIVITGNLRELMHICNERLCTAAQWEIRELVKEMRNAVVAYLPFMERWMQPKCEILGYCPESKKRSCGRKPTRVQHLETLGVTSTKEIHMETLGLIPTTEEVQNGKPQWCWECENPFCKLHKSDVLMMCSYFVKRSKENMEADPHFGGHGND